MDSRERGSSQGRDCGESRQNNKSQTINVARRTSKITHCLIAADCRYLFIIALRNNCSPNGRSELREWTRQGVILGLVKAIYPPSDCFLSSTTFICLKCTGCQRRKQTLSRLVYVFWETIHYRESALIRFQVLHCALMAP